MKRFLFGLAIFGFVSGGVLAAVTYGVGYYLSPQDKLEKADAIVAISGGETGWRAEEAIKLYKEAWAPTIIFSGAASDPNSPSNAKVMKRQAIAEGVPADAIVLDEVSQNTRQNAVVVAGLVKARGYKSIILVTSPYHQRRAYTTFKAVLGKDFKTLNHSTIDHNWRRTSWWATPYSRELTWTELQKTLFVIWANTKE